MAQHGEFSHIEFPADDLERAKAFYSKVFGWQFRTWSGAVWPRSPKPPPRSPGPAV